MPLNQAMRGLFKSSQAAVISNMGDLGENTFSLILFVKSLHLQ
jgi:hypothetical protein